METCFLDRWFGNSKVEPKASVCFRLLAVWAEIRLLRGSVFRLTTIHVRMDVPQHDGSREHDVDDVEDVLDQDRIDISFAVNPRRSVAVVVMAAQFLLTRFHVDSAGSPLQPGTGA